MYRESVHIVISSYRRCFSAVSAAACVRNVGRLHCRHSDGTRMPSKQQTDYMRIFFAKSQKISAGSEVNRGSGLDDMNFSFSVGFRARGCAAA